MIAADEARHTTLLREHDFVFVGGATHDGIPLFRAMLGAHPRIWCPPERKLVPVMAELHATWSGTMSRDLRRAGVDDAVMEAAARAWLTVFLRAGAPAGMRVVDQTPHNVLHAAWLGRIFPRARFLHLIRDGGRSSDAAARYRATVVDAAREQADAVPGRYLEVRQTDLATAPRATMEQVLAFLGEPWDDAVLDPLDASS